MRTFINIIKGLLPSKFKVGDVVDFRGQKRIEKVQYYRTHGAYFYWFEGMSNMPVSEKVLKDYEKRS